jgi:general stress protein 26
LEGIHAAEDFARLKELVEDIRVGMVTTIDDDGTLRSRPLQTLRCECSLRSAFWATASGPEDHA